MKTITYNPVLRLFDGVNRNGEVLQESGPFVESDIDAARAQVGQWLSEQKSVQLGITEDIPENERGWYKVFEAQDPETQEPTLYKIFIGPVGADEYWCDGKLFSIGRTTTETE
jgi:hypothetical protein